jgi:DNA processing protein
MLLRIRLRLKPERSLFWPVDSKAFTPPENNALTALIAQKGLLLSEQSLNLRPQAHHFPIRNCLISGLATQIIIVEAALKSGSLLTARDALD